MVTNMSDITLAYLAYSLGAAIHQDDAMAVWKVLERMSRATGKPVDAFMDQAFAWCSDKSGSSIEDALTYALRFIEAVRPAPWEAQ